MRRPVLVSLVSLSLAALSPTAARGEPPSRAAAVDALRSLRAALAFPGDTVQETGGKFRKVDDMVAFVRDEVAFVDYRGSWAGPDAVLRTRVANSADKAGLLHAMLTRQAAPARLVRADWPRGAEPHVGRAPESAAIADAVGRLRALFPDARPPDVRAAPVDALRGAVASDVARLRAALSARGLGARLEGVPTGVEPSRPGVDWVWVQAKVGGAWVDLDPVFPHLPRPTAGVTAFAAAPVRAHVRLRDGDREVVAWKGLAGDLLGRDVEITLLPADQAISAADAPASVASWRAVLVLGSGHTKGTPFAAAQSGALALETRFEDPDPRSPWSVSYGREIVRLGPGFDPHRLVAHHRVGIGLAYVPDVVVARRAVDEVLEAEGIARFARSGKASDLPSPRTGLATRSARVLNDLFLLQAAAVPGLPLGWKGPTVFVESVSLERGLPELLAVVRLDVLHLALGPGDGASRSERAAWGLATPQVEARLFRDARTPVPAGDGPLAVVDRRAVGDLGRIDPLTRRVLEEGGLLVSNLEDPRSGWLLRPTGDLLAVVADDGRLAKGAVERQKVAGQGFAALGSGAMAAIGAPSGMLVTGLAGYFSELAKAYEGAAGVLDRIGRAIETGDDSGLGESAAPFQDLAGRLTGALAAGAARGWAEGVLAGGIGHAAGNAPGAYGPTVSQLATDGVIAGVLSAPERLPGVTPAIEAAMEWLAAPPP